MTAEDPSANHKDHRKLPPHTNHKSQKSQTPVSSKKSIINHLEA
jgi:hypothetical protein